MHWPAKKKKKKKNGLPKTQKMNNRLSNMNPTDTVANLGFPERSAVHAPLMTPFVLVMLQIR